MKKKEIEVYLTFKYIYLKINYFKILAVKRLEKIKMDYIVKKLDSNYIVTAE